MVKRRYTLLIEGITDFVVIIINGAMISQHRHYFMILQSSSCVDIVICHLYNIIIGPTVKSQISKTGYTYSTVDVLFMIDNIIILAL